MNHPETNASTLEYAQYYEFLGWTILPLPRGSKAPDIQGWQELRISESELPKYFGNEENIGVLIGEASGRLIDVDLDCDEAVALAQTFLPDTKAVHGRLTRPESHWWYYAAGSPIKYKKFTDPSPLTAKQSTIVEIRVGPGRQTMVPPSLHPSGEKLDWSRSGEPSVLETVVLERSVAKLAACALIARHWPKRGTRQEAALALSGLLLQGGMRVEEATIFVEAVARVAGDEEVWDRKQTVQSTADKIQGKQTVTASGTLKKLLTGESKKVVGRVKEWLKLESGCDLAPYTCTDVGNAERFAHRHGENIRYCHTSDRWYVWDGTRWKIDDNGEIKRRAKDTVKSLLAEACLHADPEQAKAFRKYALQSHSDNKIRAMINLAKSELEVAVTNDQFDIDPWTLNVRNGTVDLRTGKLRPHKRTDMITKLAPVEYDPAATSPMWIKFLDRIMGESPNLIKFLQRAVGYGITGLTSEQVFFMLYGTGQNGKSTFLNGILAMLGDYAKTAAPNLLIAKHFESHPTEIADLEGCRFVSSVEAEHGQMFAEALVKQLTGSDPVKARHMRQDFYQFNPTHKFFIAVNHKPIIKGTDDGIWRRIRTIPFTVMIPGSEIDKALPQKLLGELPGILNWAIKGCLDWQKHELGYPEEIRAATEDYRTEMDLLGAFLDECFIRADDIRAKHQATYDRYLNWCKSSGEQYPISKRELAKRLRERGIKSDRGTGGCHYWFGIGLRGDSPMDS